ncbi:unnamed protein product [Trifolium pratense]|uniref:Uncharacterized protein n=1 Tax=Trifolium pratense TaxID=57577 RepID=A0ACB0JTK7_TRIPR|nr:unnamed protein product [Trifolium pratense]
MFMVASEGWELGWMLYKTRLNSSTVKVFMSSLIALKGVWVALKTKSVFGRSSLLLMDGASQVPLFRCFWNAHSVSLCGNVKGFPRYALMASRSNQMVRPRTMVV